MALFLVQHGKNLPPEIDPEKGLSDEGMEEVKRIADTARKYNITISCIKHSGKKRARQTAELFASILKPQNGILEITGINPLDEVESFASTIRNEDNVMYVGHLPFMERLTSYLITGSTDNPVLRFQNGGIVCFDKYPGTDFWIIKWTLMPNIH